jgi:hypothetical protein
MADKPMKIPGPDHPISIDANPSRVVATAGRKVIADTRECGNGMTNEANRYCAHRFGAAIPRR